jgi:outer membrane receptor protein involved in Fe transport
MTHKIITIAAAALAIGALAVAPRLAEAAPVTVTATVATTSTVSATNVSTTTWTGLTAEAVPFTVSVITNDAAGYTFTFTGPFTIAGTTTPGNVVTYTVTGNSTVAVGGAIDSEAYTSGTPGTVIFPGPQVTAVVSDFNLTLPGGATVPADVYHGTLQATINPQ